MKITDTKCLLSSAVREELEHIISVSPEELKEFQKALSLICSYKKLVTTPAIISSDWHNVEFRVDDDAGLVYAVVSYGMEG